MIQISRSLALQVRTVIRNLRNPLNVGGDLQRSCTFAPLPGLRSEAGNSKIGVLQGLGH